MKEKIAMNFNVMENIQAQLEIRRGKRDNLGMIFHITPLKHMLNPSLEPSRQDGSNEGSQHVFTSKK